MYYQNHLIWDAPKKQLNQTRQSDNTFSSETAALYSCHSIKQQKQLAFVYHNSAQPNTNKYGKLDSRS